MSSGRQGAWQLPSQQAGCVAAASLSTTLLWLGPWGYARTYSLSNKCHVPCHCCHVPLTLLLLPGFVTDCRSQVDLVTLFCRAVVATHHHAKAWLLEDAGVVVVGIAHGPAAQMPLRIPVIRAVDMLHIGIRPLLEQVDLFHILIETKKNAILVSARKKKNNNHPPLWSQQTWSIRDWARGQAVDQVVKLMFGTPASHIRMLGFKSLFGPWF